jgi:aryl sulfotransferase
MRRYRGTISDNARWERIDLRPDDIIITTPTKSGTTWMQTMVGMLTFGCVELPEPIGHISPWVDMATRPDDEVLSHLASQQHRRILKTHTPLDGLPWHETVTYIAVLRHPLDVAMSMRDHGRIVDRLQMRSLIEEHDPELMETWQSTLPPEDDLDFLRWWIDHQSDTWEIGAGNLAEFVRQSRTYWAVRDRPNVELFHYDDLWNDLEAQMLRLGEALGVAIAEDDWPRFVEAARLDSMRTRAASLVPETDLQIWPDPARFFGSGGRRAWVELLTAEDLRLYRSRLIDLAGADLAEWISREP